MKKTSRIHPTKDYFTPQICHHWIKIILISLFISSCSKEKKTDEILTTKFEWEPGISAPKYYPVGDVKIDFGNAGHGSLTNFDNGWGEEYGRVVSGEKFKDIPNEVYIHYISAVENLQYNGKVQLPQKKILDLFQKYSNDKNFAHLVVGMAPGGWTRVWFTTIDKQIEVAKARLKGTEDNTLGEGFRYKKSEYWKKYKNYWQHYGIPYEAWANNEKEHDIIFDFNKSNPKNEVTDPQYSSLDGTLYYRTPIDSLLKRKLPADLVAVWKSKNSNVYYDTHITFPKNFSKIIEDRKLKKVVITLEIENDDQHGILYLTSNNKKEKLLRFKTYPSKDKILGNSDFSKEIEYFIK